MGVNDPQDFRHLPPLMHLLVSRILGSSGAPILLLFYAEKLSPQEQVTTAFGFFTLKPPSWSASA